MEACHCFCWATIRVSDCSAPHDRYVLAMHFVPPIEQMTVEEKLRAMEELWADLSRHETQVPSPSWHERVLQEREQRVQSGQEAFVDWEVAKKQLRDRLT